MKFNDVNDDILDSIFSFLSVQEKLPVLRVCKRWKILILNQFQRERHLLVTAKFDSRYEIHQSNELINYNLNESQNDLNFSYLQSRGIAFPKLNFIQIKSTAKQCRYTELSFYFDTYRLIYKFSFERFENLITRFPNINSIAFKSTNKNFRLISPKILNLIFEKCSSLTTIDLTDCKELNTECLKVIAQCRTLEHLDLTNSRNYGNNGLKCILRQCTRLQALFIGYNRRLTGQFFQKSRAHLKYLDLTKCTGFSTKGMNALVENFGESLVSLYAFPIDSDSALQYVSNNFTRLRKLKLTLTVAVDLRILIDQPHFVHLSSLSLNDLVQLSNATFIKLMTNFKRIEEFELCPTAPIQTYLPILNLVKYWPNLRKLRLINVTLTPAQNKMILKSFLQFKSLESICISLTELDDQVAVYLKRMFDEHKRLQFFNLEYFQKEQKNRYTMSSIKNRLAAIERNGYFVCINQLKLSKLPRYLYLTKIAIRKYD